MNLKEQLELIQQLDQNTFEILKKKGADYSNDADTLSNFKIASSIVEKLGIDTKTPEGYGMLMVILKITRICNLKSGNKTPKNESLLDSYVDLINYAKLSYLLEIENQNNIKANTKENVTTTTTTAG